SEFAAPTIAPVQRLIWHHAPKGECRIERSLQQHHGVLRRELLKAALRSGPGRAPADQAAYVIRLLDRQRDYLLARRPRQRTAGGDEHDRCRRIAGRRRGREYCLWAGLGLALNEADRGEILCQTLERQQQSFRAADRAGSAIEREPHVVDECADPDHDHRRHRERGERFHKGEARRGRRGRRRHRLPSALRSRTVSAATLSPGAHPTVTTSRYGVQFAVPSRLSAELIETGLMAIGSARVLQYNPPVS